MGAPLPANEAERLSALRALNILDTPPEERFDRITRIAQRLFDVPIALVSLVDINRQWFKSCQGLTTTETPRSMSFCAYALERTDPLVVPDTRLDPRFVDNPLVTNAPAIRFYAGQPLAGPDGHAVGTLCILDRRPRQMTPSDLKALTDLRHWAVNELNTVELSQAYVIKHESEARVRAVLENVAEAVITVDACGRIESFNPAAERIFSAHAADVIGEDGASLFDGPDRSAVRAMLDHDAAVAGPAHPGALRDVSGRRKDGTPFPVELSISSFDLNGRRLSILIARDVSERKRAQDELERRGATLRAQAQLLDLAHDTIMVRDLDGTIRYWNRGAEEMYGWTSAEAVGRVSHRLLHTRFPKTRRTIEREVLNAGRWEGELVHSRRGGRCIVVASRWAVQRNADGAPIAVLEINNDVTERKRAEERLQATLIDAQALYRDADRAYGESRAILDATDEAIVMVGSDRRLLAVNRRFTALFGVDSSAVIGHPFEELQDLFERVFVDPADVRAQLARSSEGAGQQSTAVVAQRWPERRELGLFTAPVQGAENEPLGRLYAFRDVTHEREIDRMKSEFVSLVSHELRTPLTSIKGFVDLILDGDVGDIGEEQRELLQIVKNNADRLVALINDLLDVSRIESGKVELQRPPRTSVA